MRVYISQTAKISLVVGSPSYIKTSRNVVAFLTLNIKKKQSFSFIIVNHNQRERGSIDLLGKIMTAS